MAQGVTDPGVAFEKPEIIIVASAALGEDDAGQFVLLIVAPSIEPWDQCDDRGPGRPRLPRGSTQLYGMCYRDR